MQQYVLLLEQNLFEIMILSVAGNIKKKTECTIERGKPATHDSAFPCDAEIQFIVGSL